MGINWPCRTGSATTARGLAFNGPAGSSVASHNATMGSRAPERAQGLKSGAAPLAAAEGATLPLQLWCCSQAAHTLCTSVTSFLVAAYQQHSLLKHHPTLEPQRGARTSSLLKVQEGASMHCVGQVGHAEPGLCTCLYTMHAAMKHLS